MTESLLITGGLGYLGGRLAQYLSERPNLLLKLGTRQKKISQPSWLKRGEVIPLDLLSEESLDNACRGINQIIHLVAVNEIESQINPEEALKINSLGTLKLLRASEKAKIKRFIYLSTAHVYGAPLVGTLTEKTLPHPTHPYAITHRAAEDWILAAHNKGSIEGIVLRLSNSLGAPVSQEVNRWTLISNDLCRQAVTTGKLTLRSSGLQQRDFISIRDACRAIEHCMTLKKNQIGDGLFNLGGEYSIPVIELAQQIAARCKNILGFSPPIKRPAHQKGEPFPSLEYRIDKLKATGFFLQNDLDVEIDATIQFCKKYFKT